MEYKSNLMTEYHNKRTEYYNKITNFISEEIENNISQTSPNQSIEEIIKRDYHPQIEKVEKESKEEKKAIPWIRLFCKSNGKCGI